MRYFLYPLAFCVLLPFGCAEPEAIGLEEEEVITTETLSMDITNSTAVRLDNQAQFYIGGACESADSTITVTEETETLTSLDFSCALYECTSPDDTELEALNAMSQPQLLDELSSRGLVYQSDGQHRCMESEYAWSGAVDLSLLGDGEISLSALETHVDGETESATFTLLKDTSAPNLTATPTIPDPITVENYVFNYEFDEKIKISGSDNVTVSPEGAATVTLYVDSNTLSVIVSNATSGAITITVPGTDIMDKLNNPYSQSSNIEINYNYTP